MSYQIEKIWNYKKYKCVVARMDMGHLCGYVGIPKAHPLYGKSYSDSCEEILRPLKEKMDCRPMDDVKLSPINILCYCLNGTIRPCDVFNVNGGITYSGNKYPIDDDNWWFGYDCDHYDDQDNPKDIDFCTIECKNLADQLKEIEEQK